MNRPRWLIVALGFSATMAACEAHHNPVGLQDGEPAALFEVVDGANNGGDDDFFFLPPLAWPSSPTGDFDARRMPVVEVCEIRKGSCKKKPVARFTTSEGPRDQIIRAFADETREGVRGFYLVTWNTKKAKLKKNKIYRVRVLVDGRELGHSDFRMVKSAKEWLREWQRWSEDPSNLVIPHLKKTPLPIAFRINTGAMRTPPPAPWPHEPSGLTVMTDQPWDEMSSMGWRHLDRVASSRIASDASAPLSSPNVLEHVFPEGFPGGYGPAVNYYSFFSLPDVRELFVGLWFKTSAAWQGATSGFNVLQYVFLQGGGTLAVPMYGGPSGPFEIRVVEGWSGGELLPPNVGDGRVSPGDWHRLELYLRYDSSPGAADGVIRWWVDGEEVGDYRDRSFPLSDGFLEYQVAPTWGGVGDVKTQADYLWYDHTFISGN